MFTRVREWFRGPVLELEPREAYRLWAAEYPPYAHNLLMEVEERAVWDLLPAAAGKRVLDLACGTGRYALAMKERGAQVVGIDLSYEMLAGADGRFAGIQADMSALPVREEAVDLIICGLAVGHVADLPQAFAEMKRVLAPRGTVVYSDFHPAGRAQGWKRTFRSANRTFAVRHFPRTEEEHARAALDAGLIVETMQSAFVTRELAHADARAERYRSEWGDTPVALVVRAQKQ